MRVVRLLALVVLIGAGFVARASVPDVSVPSPAVDSSLRAVACPSPGRCVAVGYRGSKYTVHAPLAVLSDGGSWAIRSPDAPSQLADSELSALACSSTSRCVAVGRREVPAAYLGARSAGDRPLVASWDGAAWSSQDAAVPRNTADADLEGVTCVPSACVAVGEYAKRLGEDRGLAEFWDGHAWTVHLPPTPRSINERGEAVLFDVACSSADSCLAVGRYRFELEGIGISLVAPLIERWDGARWHLEHAANPGLDDVELYGIACPRPDRCVAVGAQTLRRRTTGTLAELWDGTTWSLAETPDPAGSPDSKLLDVDCPTADRCVAVGYRTSAGNLEPIAESWDGRRWSVEPITTPATFSSSTLNAIDCDPAGCRAVGTYEEQGSPILHGFSATSTGDRWTVGLVPGT